MKKILMLSGVALLGAGLTACYRIPTPDPQTTFSLQLPSDTDWQKMTLAAVYYEPDNNAPKILAQTYGGYGYSTISIPQSKLNELANNPKCTTPFYTTGWTDVVNSSSTVKTCDIVFLAYKATGSSSAPTRDNIQYQAWDVYSYATEAFNYSMTMVKPSFRSTETGTRTQGWSLVRHQVIQPSATPGQYKITMNSAPATDNGIPIVLHAPSNYFISQSLPGGQK